MLATWLLRSLHPNSASSKIQRRCPRATSFLLLARIGFRESACLRAIRLADKDSRSREVRDRRPVSKRGIAMCAVRTRRNPRKDGRDNGWEQTAILPALPRDSSRRFPGAPEGKQNSPRRVRSRSASLAANDRKPHSESSTQVTNRFPWAYPLSKGAYSSACAREPTCPRDARTRPRPEPRRAAGISLCPDRRDFFLQRDFQSGRPSDHHACNGQAQRKQDQYPAGELGKKISACLWSVGTSRATHR